MTLGGAFGVNILCPVNILTLFHQELEFEIDFSYFLKNKILENGFLSS